MAVRNRFNPKDLAKGKNNEVWSDFFLACAAGQLEGYSLVRKFGHNPDVDAAAEEDVWVVGGTYVFPSDSGTAMQVASSNAGDTQDIIIEGLDADFLEQEYPVTLTGTTPVAVGTLTRVHRITNESGTVFAGNVDVTDAATGLVVYARARPEEQKTAQVIYTVPANKTGYLMARTGVINRGAAANASADILIKVRQFGKVFVEDDQSGAVVTGSSGAPTLLGPIVLPAKTDVKLRAGVSTNDTDIAGSFLIVLVDDSDG